MSAAPRTVPPWGQRSRLRRWLPVFFGSVIAGLLVLLAALQQNWLTQVSEAQQERTRHAIRNAAAAMARDFNDSLARLALEFVVGPRMGWREPTVEGDGRRDDVWDPALVAALIQDKLVRWQRTVPEPALLGRIWVAESRTGTLKLWLFERARGRGEPAQLREIPWPAELEPHRQAWAQILRDRYLGNLDPLAAQIPALVLPLRVEALGLDPAWPGFFAAPEPPAPPDPPAVPVAPAAPAPTDRPERPRPRGLPRAVGPGFPALDPSIPVTPPTAAAPERDAGPRPFPRGPWGALGTRPGPFAMSPERETKLELLILELDRTFLVDQALPALAERHFPTGEFALEVVAQDAAPGAPPVFAWGAVADTDAVVEASAELFGPLGFRRRGSGGEPPGSGGGEPPGRGGEPPGPRERGFPTGLAPTWRGAEAGKWQLQVRHPAGSLDQAVARSRRLNLALGFGILGILGLALGALAWGARRAERLASQQMELVAGITHELLTPLAALKSAGQNLRDGVVREPAKIARYGELIVAEGSRLSDLVQQVLSFAGLAGADPSLRLEWLQPAELLERVVDEYRSSLESADFEVELDAPAGLPALYSDAAALRRALGNLVTNVLKYGRPATGRPWLGLTARAVDQGRAVAFEVQDRGPGIAEEDQRQLFEPFYRGKAVVASAIPGAGLGLALVARLAAALGARVEMRSVIGKGATFVLTVPCQRESSP